MRPKVYIICLGLLVSITSSSINAIDYSGNNLLLILGVNISAPQFKEFKTYWLLNKDYASNYGGIKLFVNDITDKVESILIAGEGLNLNNEKFDKFTAKLPFGISLNDDTTALSTKLGRGEKLIGRNTMKFYQKGLAVEVSFTSLSKGKISAVKIYKSGHGGAAVLNNASSGLIALNTAKDNIKPAVYTSAPAITETKNEVPVSPFKHSIIEIFKASQESSTFESIKGAERAEPNFWNYKYTYSTKLSVPGELYNMIYNYPFSYSQTDFVVVIKEADHYDSSFDMVYHSFEKQLLENFKPTDGWVSACISGSNKAALPNLEIRNDKVGAIILDCSQNPRGRQVLYMRFLFFSN